MLKITVKQRSELTVEGKCPYCGMFIHVGQLPVGFTHRVYCPDCKELLLNREDVQIEYEEQF